MLELSFDTYQNGMRLREHDLLMHGPCRSTLYVRAIVHGTGVRSHNVIEVRLSYRHLSHPF